MDILYPAEIYPFIDIDTSVAYVQYYAMKIRVHNIQLVPIYDIATDICVICIMFIFHEVLQISLTNEWEQRR